MEWAFNWEEREKEGRKEEEEEKRDSQCEGYQKRM